MDTNGHTIAAAMTVLYKLISAFVKSSDIVCIVINRNSIIVLQDKDYNPALARECLRNHTACRIRPITYTLSTTV